MKLHIIIKQPHGAIGGKVQLELQIAPNTKDCLIPKLILQPLAENSFEHGLLDKTGSWILTVESQCTAAGDLILRVKDNGIGFTAERLEEIRETLNKETENALRSGSHIGLANVHARIRLGCPGEGYGVTIDSKPNSGTIVSVRMKARSEEEA